MHECLLPVWCGVLWTVSSFVISLEWIFSVILFSSQANISCHIWSCIWWCFCLTKCKWDLIWGPSTRLASASSLLVDFLNSDWSWDSQGSCLGIMHKRLTALQKRCENFMFIFKGTGPNGKKAEVRCQGECRDIVALLLDSDGEKDQCFSYAAL